MDLPTAPTFKINAIGSTGIQGLDFSFYLINKDADALCKNFEFLHAFFAGTTWLQLPGGYIRGSNVYNVLIPGVLNILWASVRNVSNT